MKSGEVKRICLTGVSRGLGRAMVEGFIAGGHIVHGAARSHGEHKGDILLFPLATS